MSKSAADAQNSRTRQRQQQQQQQRHPLTSDVTDTISVAVLEARWPHLVPDTAVISRARSFIRPARHDSSSPA